MNEPKYVAETLAWCNKQRAKNGEQPLGNLPRGKRRQAYSCPCGEAANLFVWTMDFAESHDSPETDFKPLPRSVRRFVSAFDAGRLPQYEATP